MTWFVIGNLLYYAVGILLAYSLKDNRAFCKYVSRQCAAEDHLAVLADQDRQGETERLPGVRSEMLPMDIRRPTIFSTTSVSCPRNVACARRASPSAAPEALKLSFAFDIGGKELLRERSMTKQ